MSTVSQALTSNSILVRSRHRIREFGDRIGSGFRLVVDPYSVVHARFGSNRASFAVDIVGFDHVVPI